MRQSESDFWDPHEIILTVQVTVVLFEQGHIIDETVTSIPESEQSNEGGTVDVGSSV